MDLGSILTDLGSTYINARYGGPSVTYAQAPTPTPTIPADFNIPFVDVIPEMPTDNCGGSWVYKKHCGQWKWVRQKRKRQKALATKSDIRDLAALKEVLGNGKAFNTWIATRR